MAPKNLLANEDKARLLLCELNKIARNVPRPGDGFPMFTGHNGFQADLDRALSGLKKSTGGEIIGKSIRDWSGAGYAGAEMGKAASLDDDPDALHPDFEFMKSAALAGYYDAEEEGDERCMALCKEAALALEVADILESTYTQEKIAALDLGKSPYVNADNPEGITKYAPEIGGALIGALAGAGTKYVLSDPAQRKRGLTRLLDAALAGGLAGGGAGYAYRKSHEPPKDDLIAKERMHWGNVKTMLPRYGEKNVVNLNDFFGKVKGNISGARNAFTAVKKPSSTGNPRDEVGKLGDIAVNLANTANATRDTLAQMLSNPQLTDPNAKASLTALHADWSTRAKEANDILAAYRQNDFDRSYQPGSTLDPATNQPKKEPHAAALMSWLGRQGHFVKDKLPILGGVDQSNADKMHSRIEHLLELYDQGSPAL